MSAESNIKIIKKAYSVEAVLSALTGITIDGGDHVQSARDAMDGLDLKLWKSGYRSSIASHDTMIQLEITQQLPQFAEVYCAFQSLKIRGGSQHLLYHFVKGTAEVYCKRGQSKFSLYIGVYDSKQEQSE